MKKLLMIRWTVLAVVCTLLTAGALGAKDQVERPMKMKAQGTIVVSLADGSYDAIERGTATHTGKFLNAYSGYLDLVNLVFVSGSGVTTAANRDLLFFDIVGGASSALFTGGTGRFANASGAFEWLTTDLVITVDIDSMTMTLEYSYTGEGTLSY